jgi:hypothetical protein
MNRIVFIYVCLDKNQLKVHNNTFYFIESLEFIDHRQLVIKLFFHRMIRVPL